MKAGSRPAEGGFERARALTDEAIRWVGTVGRGGKLGMAEAVRVMAAHERHSAGQHVGRMAAQVGPPW
eukprot:CAMPEP_0119115008 /NCGR_PEP_ID=MMETSP1180-20130426/49477_1 /TAXON_ID=3052 ORGANISM="Chlamydomonas cf sp, Strain CCMP681" /NCGR_SAMPLE_ID=MMETSP1180 /ASSEMBLY_ACC=CAM_ASM_000741 /LENGTH=67 /DNA_ID=CAMNT_0007103797 /DNA_START=198 /DNA_END=399 /DNA_ORIENTATION=-